MCRRFTRKTYRWGLSTEFTRAPQIKELDDDRGTIVTGSDQRNVRFLNFNAFDFKPLTEGIMWQSLEVSRYHWWRSGVGCLHLFLWLKFNPLNLAGFFIPLTLSPLTYLFHLSSFWLFLRLICAAEPRLCLKLCVLMLTGIGIFLALTMFVMVQSTWHMIVFTYICAENNDSSGTY